MTSGPTDYDCECGGNGILEVCVAVNDAASFTFGLCTACAQALRSALAVHLEAPDAET